MNLSVPIMDQDLFINASEVREAFRDCLYTDAEISNGAPTDFVPVRGIIANVGFHPQRLESKRAQVMEWLSHLPTEFRADQGGGWSFLQACYQSNGVQWTSEHHTMDELFCLGIGLKFVTSLLPREMWSALPGSMPYYVVSL